MTLRANKKDTIRVSALKTGLHCGLLSGAANIFYELLLVVSGGQYADGISLLMVPAVLIIVIPIVALRKFKKKVNEPIKLKYALQIGLTIALIAATTIVSYRLMYTNLIEPDFYTTYNEVNRESLYKTHDAIHPDMTPEQFDIDMAEGINQFWKPQYTLTFISQIILSLLVSLVAGLVLKRKMAMRIT